MTKLLEEAFAMAAQLSEEEQDRVATALIEQLEEAFDRCIEETVDRLAPLAAAALADHRAGRTEPLDPDIL